MNGLWLTLYIEYNQEKTHSFSILDVYNKIIDYRFSNSRASAHYR
jgi:hypothetical protein